MNIFKCTICDSELHQECAKTEDRFGVQACMKCERNGIQKCSLQVIIALKKEVITLQKQVNKQYDLISNQDNKIKHLTYELEKVKNKSEITNKNLKTISVNNNKDSINIINKQSKDGVSSIKTPTRIPSSRTDELISKQKTEQPTTANDNNKNTIIISGANDHSVNNTWTEVVKKRKPKNNFKFNGTGDANVNIPVAESQTRKWIFVSRLQKKVSCEDIKHYLTKAGQNHSFIVEKLTPKYKDAEYSSFKIGVPLSAEKIVITEDFWPTNVFVNRFFFKSNKNFQNRQISNHVL